MFLLDSNILPKEKVEEVENAAKESGKDLGAILLELGLVKEAEL